MAVTSKKINPEQHSGRFQAQGGNPDLYKSSPWNQESPLEYEKGKSLLTDLANKLTPAEKSARTSGIIECSKEIKSINSNGGFIVVNRPYSQSFPRLPGPKGERIDLEIKKGKAFV